MNPLATLVEDRSLAFAADDPMAKTCTLALADRDGRASARTLVLREVTDNGLVVFINQSSPKWRVLASGGHYEVLLWYPSIQRQYRVQGTAQELTDGDVRESWQLRPDPGKRLDFLYRDHPQSSPIKDRAQLVQSVMARQQFIDHGHPPPNGVTAFHLTATMVERLDLSPELEVHDRRRFTLDGDAWISQVLVP
ncbi:MAG: pyridoxamine 5'-phosphate oxidase family protein [Pseudomonadota bacterium]